MSNDIEDKKRAALTLSRRRALQGLGAIALSGSTLGCASKTDVTSPAPGTAFGGAGAASAGSPAASTAGREATAGGANGQAAGSGGGSGSKAGGPEAGAAGEPTTGPAGSGGAGVAGSGNAGTSGVSGSGAAGTGAAGSGAVDFGTLDCVMTPEMTEGPFFIDENLNKSDLVTGETAASVSSGLPLQLTIGVFRVSGTACTALPGAKVDIWHADVEGVYSDVASSFIQLQDTTGKKFLRAYQMTDASGVAKFGTIYPGWYGTRTIHIHFKVRVEGSGSAAYELTSQMYFDEAINDEVMDQGPYAARGERMVRNVTDQVFNGTGPGIGADPTPPPSGIAPGAGTLVKLERLASGNGYGAMLKIGVAMG